jgi:nucleoside-diphosphate-sugar epimerase
MPRKILITGACGLIGRAMSLALETAGFAVRGFDPLADAAEGRGDVRDSTAVRAAVAACDGVLHLGAVSRVVWGERDPALCHTTNVEGTRNVLAAAAAAPTRPWVIVASSREVYGQAAALPVAEDAPRLPMNVYARSKHAAEDLAFAACRDGVRAAVVRLSNVYRPSRERPPMARRSASTAPTGSTISRTSTMWRAALRRSSRAWRRVQRPRRRFTSCRGRERPWASSRRSPSRSLERRA